MIRCPHCQTDNPLDRILCISCGKELDFSSPDLFISTEEVKAEEIKNIPSAEKIKIEENSIFASLFRFVLFSLIFTFAFLLFTTSHIPIISINEKIKNNALRKFSILNDNKTPDHYVTFNSDEISSYYSSLFQNMIKELQEKYPGFFYPKDMCIKIHNHSLEVFLEFSFLSRPLIISIKGTPYLADKKIFFKIESCRIGRIPIPVFFAKKATSPLKIFIEKTRQIPDKIISAEIDKGYLSLYKSKIISNKKDSVNSEFTPVPEDILMTQAADNFLSRKEYALAKRYYNTCLIRYPKSPLKDYIKEKLELIGNK